MIGADGEYLLQALQSLGAFDQTGWASEAALVEDLAAAGTCCWIQPGAAERNTEAGNGRHARARRTWMVVITMGSFDTTPLEITGSPLLEQVRTELTGLYVGDQKPPRRLHYIADVEPFYAQGYIELPLEFELSETFTGEAQ